MGHRPNDAAKWDAQFKSSEDECAKDMGQMSVFRIRYPRPQVAELTAGEM